MSGECMLGFPCLTSGVGLFAGTLLDCLINRCQPDTAGPGNFRSV